MLTKANSRSTVHRIAHLDYVGVKAYDERGEVVGERRFLGLYASTAYTESVQRVPLVAEKVQAVLDRSGVAPDSHTGKDLLEVLESYPRDELIQASIEQLYDTAMAVTQLQERRRTKLFIREDDFGRFVSCLVYIPRDRYNTGVRVRMADILKDTFGGRVRRVQRAGQRVGALPAAVRRPGAEGPAGADARPGRAGRPRAAPRRGQPHLVRPPRRRPALDARRGGRRPPHGPVRAGVPHGLRGDVHGPPGPGRPRPPRPARRRPGHERRALPPGRRAPEHPPVQAVPGRAALAHRHPADLHPHGRRGRRRAAVRGRRAPTARPCTSTTSGCACATSAIWEDCPHDQLRDLFEGAVSAVWDGRAESDGFNQLVLAARLTWRQVVVLRTVAKYLRQTRATYSQDYLEDALVSHPAIARDLVELWQVRFDPQRYAGAAADGERTTAEEEVAQRVLDALDDVSSLDHDRIIRAFLGVIRAGLRTNFYQDGRDGEDHKPYVSLKLNPKAVPDLPAPRPQFEIWVYSPRVEGVHLRFGPVARGGLRWSDRREDFRTEILGLVKAQMVKNAVIVPTGSKGGFYPKHLPDPAVDREAWLEEGKAAYRMFISGLLDITDNRVSGAIVPPERRRAPRRRRPLPRRRGRQGHGDVLRHRQRGRAVLRLLARRRLRLRRLGRLRPQGDGHHGPRRVGVGQAPLPRDGRRHPERGLHRRRHRRHERRRLRQRHAALRAHPARRRLRPPARLRRPEPRIAATSFAERQRLFDAAALVVGRLRPLADLRRRRGLPAQPEVDRRSPPQMAEALGAAEGRARR